MSLSVNQTQNLKLIKEKGIALGWKIIIFTTLLRRQMRTQFLHIICLSLWVLFSCYCWNFIPAGQGVTEPARSDVEILYG